MRFLFILIIISVFPKALFAQENTAIKDLLQEAKTKLFNQPEQAGKISEYIISQNEANTAHVKAFLLLAKSYYVRGNYNEAVNHTMRAKKLSDVWKDPELKAEINIFALKLFRNLGLEPVATNYLEELTDLHDQLDNKNLKKQIDGEVALDSAVVYIQSEKYRKAKEKLQNSRSLFLNSEDSASQNETAIILAEVLVENKELDAAETYLKNFEKRVNNDFERLQVLEITGRLKFNQKEYQSAVETFQKALALSKALPNKHYEYKSLEGLTVGYLALEDTKNFFSYKQQANVLATQVETDRSLAINSVYNFINSYQKELSEAKIQQSYFHIYFLAGLLVFLLIIGGVVNYIYVSKTKEYLAIYKYVAPKDTISKIEPKIEKLEKSSIVPEETEQMLLDKLLKFEAGKKYTSKDMSIALLASQFDTNTKYLSEVINRQKGKNFNAYINELRINYIIEKLKTDPVYFNYKVSYLAEESGFSSHSSFATVFKSVTGISPTKFMDFLKQRQESA